MTPADELRTTEEQGPYQYLVQRLAARQGMTRDEARAAIAALEDGTATASQVAAVSAELVATFAAIRTAAQAAMVQITEHLQRAAATLQHAAAAAQGDFALAPPRPQEEP